MIVDTGVLYAAMAPRDRNHAACAKLLRATRELLLPAPVLVELDYFLTELTSSHRAFDEVLRRIENGVFTILDLAADDYPRVRELCTQYGDWPLGFVDAGVVALAERERQTRIATLDRRHLARSSRGTPRRSPGDAAGRPLLWRRGHGTTRFLSTGLSHFRLRRRPRLPAPGGFPAGPAPGPDPDDIGRRTARRRAA